MDNLRAGIGTSFPQGGPPYRRLSSAAFTPIPRSCPPFRGTCPPFRTKLSTHSGDLVHHSGPRFHRSAAHPESGQLHVGITGQLPPESLDNFDRNQWSTWPGIRTDDANYVYEAPNHCLNKEMDGTAIGECVIDNGDGAEDLVNAWSEGQRWLRAGVQAWAAFPGCSEGSGHEWSGKMRVCSVGYRGQFYSYSPHSFNTGDEVISTASCSYALATAWQGWGDGTGHLDSGIQRIVIPLATFWHNMSSWPKGWQTKVQLQNYSATTTDVWVQNPLTKGLHGHSSTCTQGHAWDWAESTPVTLAPNQSTVIDLFRDLDDTIADNKGVWHDSVGFIKLDPVVSGLGQRLRFLRTPVDHRSALQYSNVRRGGGGFKFLWPPVS